MGTPTKAPRLADVMGAPVESSKKPAVRMDVELAARAFGVALFCSTNHGLKLAVPVLLNRSQGDAAGP